MCMNVSVALVHECHLVSRICHVYVLYIKFLDLCDYLLFSREEFTGKWQRSSTTGGIRFYVKAPPEHPIGWTHLI